MAAVQLPHIRQLASQEGPGAGRANKTVPQYPVAKSNNSIQKESSAHKKHVCNANIYPAE
jgi:hypothetical protein